MKDTFFRKVKFNFLLISSSSSKFEDKLKREFQNGETSLENTEKKEGNFMFNKFLEFQTKEKFENSGDTLKSKSALSNKDDSNC